MLLASEDIKQKKNERTVPCKYSGNDTRQFTGAPRIRGVLRCWCGGLDWQQVEVNNSLPLIASRPAPGRCCL